MGAGKRVRQIIVSAVLGSLMVSGCGAYDASLNPDTTVIVSALRTDTNIHRIDILVTKDNRTHAETATMELVVTAAEWQAWSFVQLPAYGCLERPVYAPGSQAGAQAYRVLAIGSCS